jgi:hypothetical protein
METVTGVFQSCEAAQRAAADLRYAGISNVNFLAPGASAEQLNRVPTSETEQPGMGAALGGVVGAALGIAGGLELGAAAATAVIPGVGPVVAVGMLAAAVLGTGGGVTGAAVGAALEHNSTTGLPADELFFYKDALRQGRCVVFAGVESADQAKAAHVVLARYNAESLDAAREAWWIGIRSAEQEHYEPSEEADFRRGYESAALGRVPDLATESDAFRRGYHRGSRKT